MRARGPHWTMLAVPAAAALWLYWPVLGTGYLGDDFGLLHAFDGCDGVAATLRCVGEMFAAGVGPPSNQYRPLTMASFALNAGLSADPFGWHLANVLLQMGNAALVALLAWLVLDDDTPRTRMAAIAAGWLFAWFAPAVEATAWIAARFDGMALLWMLVAACAFMASRRWHDGFSVASLGATVLSYTSKESAAIGAPLILALAWYREGLPRGLARALPWLALAAGYFAYRRWLFGDAFRFFPGSSPLDVLLSGAWLAKVPDIAGWARITLTDPAALTVFTVSGTILAVCAAAAGVAERRKGRALVALAFALVAAFALLLPHWQWPGTGEGGRVLLSIGAIACVACALPLAAARQPRGLAWAAAIALLGSQYVLASATVERWVRAGEDSATLARALAQLAQTMPPESYAFVVIPDHVGAIPFGRNAQIGYMLPPVQERPLTQRLVVQTELNLAPWPDQFARDVIGRMKRESFDPRPSLSSPPKTSPPWTLPDRYLCWSARRHELEPVELALDPDLGNWMAEWNRVLGDAGCRE